MTVFDYVFIAVLLISALIGMWRGLVSEVLALVAWGLGLFVAYRFSSRLAPMFSGVISEPAWRLVLAFAVLFLAVLLILAVLRFLIRGLLKAVGLGLTDRFFGALFGLLRGLAIALLVVVLGGLTGVAGEPWWRGAMFSRPLERVVLAGRPWMPEAIAKRISFR